MVVSVGLLTGCASGEKVAGRAGEVAPLPVAAPVTSADAPPAEPTPVSTPVEPPTPVTVKKTVIETKVIPFKKRTVLDSSVTAGEKSITTRGVNGVRRLTYEVTLVGGVATAKRLVKQVVAIQPVTQITTVGTKVDEPSSGGDCDPNYSDCVPIASDVDCAGGSGNGPEYVEGPVTVIGSDIYGLDADNDGIGCEN